MLLDLLPLFTPPETVVVTGGTSGPLHNPLPQHRQPRHRNDDEEALLVAALI